MLILNCWLYLKLWGRSPLPFGSLQWPLAHGPEAVSSPLLGHSMDPVCVCAACVNGQSQEGFCHSIISHSATSLNIAGRQPLAQGKSSVLKRQTAIFHTSLKNFAYFPNAPVPDSFSESHFLGKFILPPFSSPLCMFYVNYCLPCCTSRLLSGPTSIQSQGSCRTSPAEGVESIPLPPLSSCLI